MYGVEAVFLTERCLVVDLDLGLTHAGLDMIDLGMLVDKLKGVAVACDQHYPVLRTFCGDCAEQIVRLPALKFIAADVHRVQRFLENRHLHRQLLRHTLALSLVALVLKVTEGGRLEVEGNAHRVRLDVLFEPAQNIQKAVDCVRRRSVGCIKLPHAEECTVHYAVSVDDHKCHRSVVLSVTFRTLLRRECR